METVNKLLDKANSARRKTQNARSTFRILVHIFLTLLLGSLLIPLLKARQTILHYVGAFIKGEIS